MSGIVIVIGLFTMAIGLASLVSPRHIVRLINNLKTPFGLYVSAGLRVLFGVSLWFAAPTSRAPDVLQALGAVFVVTGLIRPILGPKVIREMLGWWGSRPGLVRAWGCIAIAFGSLLIYWVSP
jgi:uncharacterized protein YjeT (DUF2065 family)